MRLELERLVGDVEWAKAQRLPARDLVPMLRRLVAVAPEGSPERTRAVRDLAEQVLPTNPWQAARLARDVLKSSEDHRAFGVLGLAHTLLGNHQSARRAYHRALRLAPGCASYAHNLGHLIDVVFNRPREALHWLRRAHLAAPDEAEIAASYAHALARSERLQEAAAILTAALQSSEGAWRLLERWRERPTTPSRSTSAG